MIYIFDLDGTVIDSAHRLGNGSISYYNRNKRFIYKDSRLPLADLMNTAFNYNWAKILICTSRVLNGADYRSFTRLGLQYDEILSRSPGQSLPCADLKEGLLTQYASSLGLTFSQFCKKALMFEDTISVIDRMRSLGLNVIDANSANLHK